MRLLLDTNAWLRWLTEPELLPEAVLSAIFDPENDVLISTVTTWEITIKYLTIVTSDAQFDAYGVDLIRA